jgi:hypothetical protein
MKEYPIVTGMKKLRSPMRTDEGRETRPVTYSVEVNRVRAELYWMNWNGKSIEVSVPEGRSYSVSIGGRRIEAEILDPRRNPARLAP